MVWNKKKWRIIQLEVCFQKKKTSQKYQQSIDIIHNTEIQTPTFFDESFSLKYAFRWITKYQSSQGTCHPIWQCTEKRGLKTLLHKFSEQGAMHLLECDYEISEYRKILNVMNPIPDFWIRWRRPLKLHGDRWPTALRRLKSSPSRSELMTPGAGGIISVWQRQEVPKTKKKSWLDLNWCKVPRHKNMPNPHHRQMKQWKS